MPPINRDKNTEYVILIITDGTKKILDITTEKNRRNYKFKILNELKAKTDKRNLVCQEFKNSNVDAIDIEVLDNINGTYLDALKYMDKIATKYNYKTTKAINTTILDMQIELKATKTNEEPVMENEDDTFTHKTPPTQTTEEHEEEPAPVEEVKKPKKAVQKIKLKPLEDDKVTKDITEAINTPINKPTTSGIVINKPKLTTNYEEDEELEQTTITIEAEDAKEDLEYKVILPSLNKPKLKATKQKTNTKPPIAIVIDVDEEEEVTPPNPKINRPTTSGIVKLTKKQEQQKNKLIQDNAQTITEYYTLKKEKDCLEAKMNTLHLAILTNYTTLANSFQYADGSINDFNFE